jgi:hypothetical protein
MQRVPYELVKSLRARTGQSLARCKEALAASGGDLDAAECWLAGVPIHELGNSSPAAAPAPAPAPVLVPTPVAAAAAPPLNGFTPTTSERGSAGAGDGGILDSFMQFATPPSGFGAPPSGMGIHAADMPIGLSTAPPAVESALDAGSLFAGLSVGSTPPSAGAAPRAPAPAMSQGEPHETIDGPNSFGGVGSAWTASEPAAVDAAHVRIATAAAAEAAPVVAEAAEARRALEAAQRESTLSDERRVALEAEASRSAAALAEAERAESEAEAALAAAEAALSRTRHQRGLCARQAEDASTAAAIVAEACSRLSADVLDLTAREAEAAAVADRVRREAEARLRAEEEEARRRAQADELRRRAEELRRQADALNPHSSRTDRSKPAVSASSSMSSLLSGGLGSAAAVTDPFGMCGPAGVSPGATRGCASIAAGCGAARAFGLSLCSSPTGSEAAGASSQASVYNGAGGGGTASLAGTGALSGRGVSANLEALLLGLNLDTAALDRLLSTLAQAEVDTVRALRLLTEADYKELGVSIGMRRKLLHALDRPPEMDTLSAEQTVAGGGVAAGAAALPHAPAAPAVLTPAGEPGFTPLSSGERTPRPAESALDADGTPAWLSPAAAKLDSLPAPPIARVGQPPASPMASPQLLPSAHAVAASSPGHVARPSAPPYLPVGAAAIYRGQPVTVVAAHTDDPAGPYYAVQLADGSVRHVDGSLEEATPESLQRAMEEMQREMARLHDSAQQEQATGPVVERGGDASCTPFASGVQSASAPVIGMAPGSTGQQGYPGARDFPAEGRGEYSSEEAVAGAGGSAASAFSFLSAPAMPTGVSGGALAADLFGGENAGCDAGAAADDEPSMLPSNLVVEKAPGSGVVAAGRGAASAFSFMSG